jgi:hypothetical protein
LLRPMAKNRARATQGNALSQHQAGVDTPCYIDARTRYDAAMKAVGPWLGASQWGRLNGRSLAEGCPAPGSRCVNLSLQRALALGHRQSRSQSLLNGQ